MAQYFTEHHQSHQCLTAERSQQSELAHAANLGHVLNTANGDGKQPHQCSSAKRSFGPHSEFDFMQQILPTQQIEFMQKLLPIVMEAQQQCLSKKGHQTENWLTQQI